MRLMCTDVRKSLKRVDITVFLPVEDNGRKCVLNYKDGLLSLGGYFGGFKCNTGFTCPPGVTRRKHLVAVFIP